MTVGETLTEARAQAGLSVDELSERTRIRGTVIRSIEQDDYEACGGDLYVRGYVRALAGAVGIDAQPLIREFDMGRASSAADSGDRQAGGYASVASPGAPTSFDLPVVSDAPAADAPAAGAGLDATRFDLPAVSAEPAATAYDLPLVPEVPPTAEFAAAPLAPEPPAEAQSRTATETRFDLPPLPDDLMAAGYDFTQAAPAEADSATKVIPPLGADPAGPRGAAEQPAPAPAGAGQPGATQAGPVRASTGQAGRGRGKRRGLIGLAAVVVLAAAAGAGIYLATGNTARSTAATSVPNPAAASAAKASAAARASASAAAKASADAAASASASAKARQAAAARAAAQRVVALPVASVTAFGPSGLADGDNPGNAQYAVARDAAQPWQSQWYATPDFGMLRHGTGLLLNLGGKATVTSVRLDLAPYRGSNVQIRVGNGTAPQDLTVAATAGNAGGVVKLTLLHPVAARYLLIWFTQLPPDGLGHYQASVSHVVVSGRR